jgi:transcriptional regulator with XRE-family HTH domain
MQEINKEINNFIKAIDLEVGNRIHSARIFSGLTTKEIANSMGITIQQLYKYEKGLNKISLGRLILMSRKLNRNFSEFYSNLTTNSQSFSRDDLVAYDQANRANFSIQTLKFITKIKEEHHQQALLALFSAVIKSFVKTAKIK